jgi:nitrate/nitrite-specific signal transduction histidine kinase
MIVPTTGLDYLIGIHLLAFMVLLWVYYWIVAPVRDFLNEHTIIIKRKKSARLEKEKEARGAKPLKTQ